MRGNLTYIFFSLAYSIQLTFLGFLFSVKIFLSGFHYIKPTSNSTFTSFKGYQFFGPKLCVFLQKRLQKHERKGN